MNPKTDNQLYQLNLRVSHEFERLLKNAPPRPLKKHQLVKTLQDEDPLFSRREIESRVIHFYQIPYERRTERQFDRQFKIRPYPWLMQQFDLNFSTAAVSETAMSKVAFRFRHQFRFLIDPPDEINSVEFLHLVIYRTANPRWDQVNAGIDLPIFAKRWRAESFARFGEKHEDFFCSLDQRLDAPYEEPSAATESTIDAIEPTSTTDLNMTQSDLEWMKKIILALDSGQRLPLYPLQRRPSNPTLLRMEQLVRAAYQAFPQKHRPIEDALRRSCLQCLSTFRQRPKSELKESA